MMSHFTCDRVELSVGIWLEKLIQRGALKMSLLSGPQWGNNSVWRRRVTQQQSVFIHIHEWPLPAFVSPQGRSVKLLKCVENMSSVHSVSFRRTKKSSGIWIFPPGVCGETKWVVHITSEPPQCQLFRNGDKRLFRSSMAAHLSPYPKGIQRRVNVLSPEKKK